MEQKSQETGQHITGDKMKKILIFILTILMVSFAFAQVEPTPIIGKLTINGKAVTGYQIEMDC